MLQGGAEVDGEEVLCGDEGEGRVLVVVAAQEVVPASCTYMYTEKALQVYTYIGRTCIQAHWYTGLLVYRYTGIQRRYHKFQVNTYSI